MEQTVLLFKLAETSLLFSVIRVFVFSSFFAVFAWAHCNRGVIRAAIALSLAMPVAMHLSGSDVPMPSMEAPGEMILIVLKEALIGFGLACLFSAPFWAVGAAGAALSMLRVESSDGDPQLGSTPLERLLLLLTIGAFAFSDAPARMLTVLYLSYEAWPIATLMPQVERLYWSDLTMMLKDVMIFACVIVLPFIISSLFIESLLAFSSKIAKHVKIQESMLFRSFGIVVGLVLSGIVWLIAFSDFLSGFYNDVGSKMLIIL